MIKNKKPYHHGDLKKALIDASMEILKNEGYQALSLRKVSKHAAVSQSAPYRHFADLESLIAEIALEGFKLLTMQLLKIKKRMAKHPLLQYRETGLQYVEFAVQNPDLFQIMYGNQIPDHSKFENLVAAESETFQVLVDIISDCKNAGVLKTKNIRTAAMASWTMVHGIAVLLSGRQVMFRNLKSKEIKSITKDLLETLYTGMKVS
ncbi:TetR/AcrR family transcriptional regulator [Leptospira sp. GIMC2001]|uniref:TetR/AcrR family transcriptional regulator n=1 Tax=Leptospira sp. GIMC2001 TaxID=1513297 RepID=UPI00234964BC|nr:TetR/AcrR family transcriptional regulator [Leptospira sp. GIMC2001]WCL48462.1 TetR/AcrR family transcriptional regulator [Leptospira sp. GIMC2001]